MSTINLPILLLTFDLVSIKLSHVWGRQIWFIPIWDKFSAMSASMVHRQLNCLSIWMSLVQLILFKVCSSWFTTLILVYLNTHSMRFRRFKCGHWRVMMAYPRCIFSLSVLIISLVFMFHQRLLLMLIYQMIFCIRSLLPDQKKAITLFIFIFKGILFQFNQN